MKYTKNLLKKMNYCDYFLQINDSFCLNEHNKSLEENCPNEENKLEEKGYFVIETDFCKVSLSEIPQ